MNQEKTIEKITSEILLFDLMPGANVEIVQWYLSQAYAAGFDHGRIKKKVSIKERSRIFP